MVRIHRLFNKVPLPLYDAWKVYDSQLHIHVLTTGVMVEMYGYLKIANCDVAASLNACVKLMARKRALLLPVTILPL